MIADEPPKPDLSGFSQPADVFGGLTAGSLVALAGVVSGELGHATPPDRVPHVVLEAMRFDPVIYMGEMSVIAPVLSPDLYYVRHSDPVVKAETEEWLWPILRKLTTTISRAYALGVAPYVTEWTVGDLVTLVQREGAERPRRSTARAFYRYSDVYDLAPSAASVLPDRETGRRLEGLRHGDRVYGADRAFCAVWDRQYGDWRGMGSRRRAYRAWFREQLCTLWQSRYLERSVDSPRIGRAPAGTIKVGSQERPATEILNAALMALKNGGAATIPSTVVDGQPVWGIDKLDLPDRSVVWETALNRFDAQKLLACLVPPSTVGLEDASFSGARIPAQQFVEFVQSVATFVACEITSGPLRTVHRANYGDDVPAPELLAYEIPAAKKKLLLSVFSSVQGAQRRVGDGQVVTLGELVSEEILDQLGIPRRATADAARDIEEPEAPDSPGLPGRPIDVMGDREERRENAREPEGEDATGGDGEQVDA